MAGYELREGQGSLFANLKRKSDKAPQYRGDIKINGQVYEIAAWVRQGKSGEFFSLQAKEKDVQYSAPSTNRGQPQKMDNGGVEDLDNDLPF